MHLVYPRSKPEDEPEEIVLRVQGFVIQSRLPPILNRKQYVNNIWEEGTYLLISQYRLGDPPINARQSVTLSGLGAENFAQALQGMMRIQQYFGEHCSEGQMESWEPRKDRGHPVLTIGNRYLSTLDGKDTKQQTVTLEDAIDPFHILREATPSGVHTTENQVLYFQRTTKGTG